MDREFFNSTVSWGAIAAGSIVAVGVTLLFMAFGIGGGLAIVSPWQNEGVSATTFSWLSGIALVCLAMIASAFGGYVTGLLRHGWDAITEDERYFRDTVHGFVTWAFATVLTVFVIGAAGTHILAGASAGSIPAAGAGAAQEASNGGDIYVDRLLRTNRQGTQAGNLADTRGELLRIITPGTVRGGQVADADRAYAAQIVAARTGLSPEDARRRVDETIAAAKDAADKARKAAMKLALWSAVAMLAGALVAALAAAEGGKIRNRYLVPVAVTVGRP
jgi:hypothetical protein